MGGIKNRLDPECPLCGGVGYFATEDDWEYCRNCVGAPREPAYPVTAAPGFEPGPSPSCDDDIPFDRLFSGKNAAQSFTDLVNAFSEDVTVGTGEVDVFEDAGSVRLGFTESL